MKMGILHHMTSLEIHMPLQFQMLQTHEIVIRFASLLPGNDI